MAKKKGKKLAQRQSSGTTGTQTGRAQTSRTQTAATRAASGRGPFWWDDHIARLIRMFFAGALGAMILSLIVWLLSLGLFNVNTMVVPPGASGAEQLNPLAVLIAIAIPALVAAILYYFMDKSMGERTWNIFLIISVIVAVLSLIPVWGQPVSTGSKVTLSLMHIVSAVGILWGIRYTLGYFPESINRWTGATS